MTWRISRMRSTGRMAYEGDASPFTRPDPAQKWLRYHSRSSHLPYELKYLTSLYRRDKNLRVAAEIVCQPGGAGLRRGNDEEVWSRCRECAGRNLCLS